MDKLESKIDRVYVSLMGDGVSGGLLTRVITAEKDLSRLRQERDDLERQLDRVQERMEEKTRHEAEMARDIRALHQKMSKAQNERNELIEEQNVTRDELERWRNRIIGAGIGLGLGAGGVGGLIGAVLQGLVG